MQQPNEAGLGAPAPRAFLDDRFLLRNGTAVRLFEQYAKDAPIVDFHCHIPPADIATDRRFATITELWLGGDHYKWRALRGDGVPEACITGSASDREKFHHWAAAMPRLIGNPLHHWTHLELRRYFGITDVLGPDTEDAIWTECNRQLADAGFSARNLIRRSNVKALCTTDDPTDTLEHHLALAADPAFAVKVLPTFRPDRALYLERPGFVEWIAKLAAASDRPVASLADLALALDARLDFFAEAGCRLSDHSLEPVVYEPATTEQADAALRCVLAGGMPDAAAVRQYRTWLMVWLGRQYARRGWTMQLHMLAQRNNNRRMFRALGPDTGFDTMGDDGLTAPLARLLDDMDDVGELPRTILYSLNGRDLDALGALAGCFQGGGMAGRIQLGAAWWFNDTRDGMERHLRTLGNLGVFGRFIGMLTDSRSLISYPRHEYFRRILCNLLGEWVEAGEVPDDEALLGGIVADLCHRNAEAYLGLE